MVIFARAMGPGALLEVTLAVVLGGGLQSLLSILLGKGTFAACCMLLAACRLVGSEGHVLSFSGPRIGSLGASCFVDDFVSCWGKRGAYRLLLEPS